MDRYVCGLAELKFDSTDAKAMTFSGYGAVFGNVDLHEDVIVKGAFREAIGLAKKTGQWPSMLLQHGGFFNAADMMPVGVWTDMSEDDVGLKLEGKLADTERGREAYSLLKMEPRPALNGLSIGYRVKEAAFRTKPEEPRRTIKKVDLFEVSLVTFPANPKARVQSVKGEDMTERDFERWLTQDAGLSRSEARVVINQGFKAFLATRDAGSEGVDDLLALSRRLLSNHS